MTEKVHLTGTITNARNGWVNITADDGDWYGFKSKKAFQEGDRVSFDAAQTNINFARALEGGPIRCSNVKLIKGERMSAEELEKLKPGSGTVNILVVSKSRRPGV